MRAQLLVVTAGFAPITQRAGTNEDSVSGTNIDLFPLKSLFQIVRRNCRAAAQCLDLLEAGNVHQNGPQNHGWNRRHVSFANPPIAAPIGFLEAVIPVVVVARGNMPQAINLRRHVVVDEER